MLIMLPIVHPPSMAVCCCFGTHLLPRFESPGYGCEVYVVRFACDVAHIRSLQLKHMRTTLATRMRSKFQKKVDTIEQG